ncbi:MFS transporter [Segniliparus rugosus]|uniref:Major facilitator superfamily (MFS) profile domain-containing protein n=1 Tax=Segniliparus rugosus (strain ATCC BAA-974 / DSM 45345 / CCUG 50838 / CIP 108380 / JCM 13579 / CDC 945) TaxID=679197 RepID=E5XL36_SEGRC|nr:MFS transporter [Segniliparus rugosus]EFV14904.1 hypothetical protein HMPREF9336_00205 [Segniliparus rugosus ATCC BAA-974]
MASSEKTPAALWQVGTLGFGAFAAGTDEFVLAGVLPQFSSSLQLSVATAGQVVTVFALTSALAAPVLAVLTAAWPRKRVLLTGIAAVFAGNVVAALATSFPQVLVGMAVAALGAGLFIPGAAATAAAIAGPKWSGQAIAIVFTGMTVAMSLGAPIGTIIANSFDWHATMWFVVLLAGLAAPALALWVPEVGSGEDGDEQSLRSKLAPLADRKVLVTLLTTTSAFIAIYIVYTYISAIFAGATGGSGDRLAALLFVYGLVGVVANYVSGVLADRFGPRWVVASTLLLLIALLVAMPLAENSFGPALFATAVYGYAGWAVSAPQQFRLISIRPKAAAILASLHSTSIYLAISLSGIIGGFGLSALGAGSVTFLAAAFGAAALVLSEISHRMRGCAAEAETDDLPEPDAVAAS